MRGKGGFAVLYHLRDGITPAYAGKRAIRAVKDGYREDHPRVCGEKSFLGFILTLLARITPAYAGKSCRWALRGTCPEDHPRVCGEKNGRPGG